MSSLDNLKKEAKRWLKALRGGDARAKVRLFAVTPGAGDRPGLREVQHALAREHGFASWPAMADAVSRDGADDGRQEPAVPTGGRTHAERVNTFLSFGCWDHHVHGVSDHNMYARAAERLLRQHPEIARDSLYTAVVSGDRDEVDRVLAAQPDAAREPGGGRGWDPILYLCYTRCPHQPSIDSAVTIARALLDRGADPNAFYMAGAARYTALVGAAGEGEQASPRQPQAPALFQLLLERGAEPFDIQVLYNTHFSCDMVWWLDLVYEYTVAHGRRSAWDDPDWTMLSMGGYGPGAYFILWAAIERNAVDVVRWALTRGANPNLPTSPQHHKFRPRHTLLEQAQVQGLDEIAALLIAHGATRSAAVVDEHDVFLADCFRMDRAAVRAHLDRHPEYLRSTKAIFAAARRDRDDVVAMLLDFGVPIEIEDERRQRTMHIAAGDNAMRVVSLLLARGAEIDPLETTYTTTPLGYAVHYWHQPMVAFLSQRSRDVWRLAFTGNLGRLREVLRTSPELARSVAPDGTTLLWWLPEDPERALQIVELLLAHGADPSVRLTNGRTAADWALKAGLPDVAQRLGVFGTPVPDPVGLEKYDVLARDLVIAFETGRADAMARVQQRTGATFTWKGLRQAVRDRLDRLPAESRPPGYFALPHARLLVAMFEGFDSWEALAESVGSSRPVPHDGAACPDVELQDLTPRMIRPIELAPGLPVRLHDGTETTADDVWAMLNASLEGDLDRIATLVDRCPSLVRCDHNYMPPLHLAVREGHLDVVRYLASRGAVNPAHVTYPYNETLLTLARDRGLTEIAHVLEAELARPDPDRRDDENTVIDLHLDPPRRQLESLVGADNVAAVDALLEQQPELARDPRLSLGEGILSGPSNRRRRRMLDLLIRFGARVPDLSKWAHAYYFKHDEIAALHLDHGMNPNHMDVHHTTLLHQMAWKGDVLKLQLLLDRGAALDPVDEEFRSTPLGLAARWGRRDVVAILIARGADVNKAGAAWAAPLAWARAKGHAAVADQLRRAGAEDPR